MNNSQPSHVPFIEPFHFILSKKNAENFQKCLKKIELCPCAMYRDPHQEGGGSGGGLFNRAMSPGSTQDSVLGVVPWHWCSKNIPEVVFVDQGRASPVPTLPSTGGFNGATIKHFLNQH